MTCPNLKITKGSCHSKLKITLYTISVAAFQNATNENLFYHHIATFTFLSGVKMQKCCYLLHN